jgi:hypothetical protein
VGSRSRARARAKASEEAGQARDASPAGGAKTRLGTGTGTGAKPARAGTKPDGAKAAGADPKPARTSPEPADATGTEPALTPLAPATTPATLIVAAVIELVEAVGVLAAAILAGVDTGQGRSYQLSSGIAITLIGVATALGLALTAAGLRRTRRWARTPALLTQLFTGIVGIYLLQGGRYGWGAPAIVLALAGFGTLLARPSTQALTAGLPQPQTRHRYK